MCSGAMSRVEWTGKLTYKYPGILMRKLLLVQLLLVMFQISQTKRTSEGKENIR